jgi:putative addiction module component (TIGR02574 family)
MSTCPVPFDPRQFSVAERIEMIEAIWDTVVDEGQLVPLSDAQRAEVSRRMADRRAAPDDVVSWEDIKQRLAQRKS